MQLVTYLSRHPSEESTVQKESNRHECQMHTQVKFKGRPKLVKLIDVISN